MKDKKTSHLKKIKRTELKKLSGGLGEGGMPDCNYDEGFGADYPGDWRCPRSI